jgi:hypothetical protein
VYIAGEGMTTLLHPIIVWDFPLFFQGTFLVISTWPEGRMFSGAYWIITLN